MNGQVAMSNNGFCRGWVEMRPRVNTEITDCGSDKTGYDRDSHVYLFICPCMYKAECNADRSVSTMKEEGRGSLLFLWLILHALEYEEAFSLD